MKKIVLLALLLVLSEPAWAATSVLFNWTNSNPVCSATVTTSCVKSATLTDTTTNTVISSTITADTFTYTPTGGIPFGWTHTFSLVLNGVDASGNAVTSAPATVTVSNSTLNPPTGFTATLQ